MGTGRKKQTIPLGEKGPPKKTINCSTSARNLGKKALGGVIFGAKHCTFEECVNKQLFGLPYSHYSYVKNVTIGMPLFLFNYSDRKLHGIFEAASNGQLNINPYGWTIDGSETHYPVQVRTKIRVKCEPLTEDQFKPIIADNYYKHNLFWFELDKAQTSRLISLFSSAPAIENASSSQSTGKRGTSFWKSFSAINTQRVGDFGPNGENSSGQNFEAAGKKDTQGMHGNVGTSFPHKTWESLFKPHISETGNVEGNSQKPAVEASKSCKDHISIEQDSSCSLDNDIENWEDLMNDQHNSEVSMLNSEQQDFLDQEAMNPLLQNSKSIDAAIHEIQERKDTNMTVLELFQEYSTERGSTFVEPPLCEESRLVDAPLCVNAIDVLLKTGIQSSECSNNSMAQCASFVEEMLSLKSSSLNLIMAELVREIENLKLSQLRQNQKISTMEHELVQSRAEIQTLKNSIGMSKSRSTPTLGHNEGELQKSSLEPDFSIFLVGGYDGHSWLSSLISYLPSQDLIKSLNPMSSVRSYGSAAKLDGQLYVFGGGDGTLWYDTVEAYDPANDQWVKCPSLNRKRGSSAGASLKNKIYAIGGGNGVECFSQVEMLDLDVGSWITTSSMLQKRFSLAAAEIDGALYVVGGYDGQGYLKSVERFDAREPSWTRLGSMSTERGCHSVAVLNGKLYALGGYDGTHMVSTVEMFDPRMGLWATAESMSTSRGYMGAVTIGNSIYVIGGMHDDGEVLDTSRREPMINSWTQVPFDLFVNAADTQVERYSDDGRGWEVIKTQSIGRRCFFSAMVI